MEDLCQSYWPPVYAYIRRRGYSPHEAEELTQDFFLRLIDEQSLAGVQRNGGKFRSFLLKSAEYFLANEWDRRNAQKRGGGQRLISLNSQEAEARCALEHSDQETPESIFERRWVCTLLEHVGERLRRECAGAGKSEWFDLLHPCLQGDRSGPSHATLAGQLGMSEGAVKVAVHRLRQRYGEILRDEIARTVATPEEVNGELRYLMSVLGR